jgi:hypothetical protein
VRLDGRPGPRPVLFRTSCVRLLTEVGPERISVFSFSVDDGLSFHPWPDRYALRSGGHRGDRIGLYTCADGPAEGTPGKGHADFDHFDYEFSID